MLWLSLLPTAASADPIDQDQDGWLANAANPIERDCDDATGSVNPAALETVGNVRDEDCDGNDALRRTLIVDRFDSEQWAMEGAAASGDHDLLQVSAGGHAQMDVAMGDTRGLLFVVVDVEAAAGPPCTLTVRASPDGGAPTSEVEELGGAGTRVLAFPETPPPPAHRLPADGRVPGVGQRVP